MQFSDLKQSLNKVKPESLRMDCDNLFEAVFTKTEIGEVTVHLESFFGVPVFPSQTRLSFHIQEAVKQYGGVMQGQTLYCCRKGQDLVFAMLWPWSDGVRTTIKVVKQAVAVTQEE